MFNQAYKYFALLFIVISLLACGESSNNSQARITISTLIPPVADTGASFQDLQGLPLEISDYKGKMVVLNYWATWCAPCIREIPSLTRAANILEDEGFVFLLSSDESLAEISEFVAEHEFEGNFIKLNSFFASYGVEAVPSTMLFNENGEIINSWLGEYEWDSSEILSELRESK